MLELFSVLTLILSILKEVENSSTLQDDISGCFAFFSLLSIHIANLFGIISSMGLIGESLRFTIANQRIKNKVSLYDITPKGKSDKVAALSVYSLSIFSCICSQ